MHVVVTAGHVDHGKSTLVRALTGMEPDRWAEERRRGMTIDLGFAWTTLPSGGTVAFVDVPGHQRFVPNMLAGAGPVPAAMIVVAADEGWMPQSGEHLAALDALGVSHGLLVVTRADLAGPGPAMADARARIARSSLGAVPSVAVSAVTGDGLTALLAALDELVAGLPPPSLDAPVRLWVDRSFTIRGSGTVVTGTLGAGTVRAGDTLMLGNRTVRVRGLQALGKPAEAVPAVARVAVNLRGIDKAGVRRGDALLTPGAWSTVEVVDVRVHGAAGRLPGRMTLHVGAAAVGARVRPLGDSAARLRLERVVPLRLGDRALLRDPGHRVGPAGMDAAAGPGAPGSAGVPGSAGLVVGVTVLDVAPPVLAHRGAAARRAAELATADGAPDLAGELRRRGLARRSDLARWGVPGALTLVAGAPGAPVAVAGEWLADPGHWVTLRERLGREVDQWLAAHPLEPGAPVEALRHALGLPDRCLVDALVAPPLTVADGRVGRGAAGLPPPVAAAVAAVRADLAVHPFAAPDAGRLADLGLGARQLAAAVRAGVLLRVADGVVLAPDALDRAAEILAGLPQPFTLSAARQALGTTRRVAVPLLELLDRTGRTHRLPDDRRASTG